MSERARTRLFNNAARVAVLGAIAVVGIAVSPGQATAQTNPTIFLHGSGSNPPALFLDTSAPTAAAPKFKDSAGVAFSGGNPWKEIGTWTAAPAVVAGTIGNLSAYVGLKNSDDQGTQFDLRAEVSKNGTLIGSGQTSCVTGVTRNPDQAKNIVVSLGALTFGAADVLSVKVSTRIGTTGTGTFCGGHASATGLRFYFDGASRPSRLEGSVSQLAAPSLIRVVAATGNSATLLGRVDGAQSQSLTLQVFACTSGVPDSTPISTTPSPITVSTDASGYFITPPIATINSGQLVAVQVATPQATAKSACIPSSADNDFWPKALDISSSPPVGDYIDSPGKARWYKVNVKPGQQLRVGLTGLPADYDLAVFKDIGAAFSAALPADTAALTKMSAEYAPSVFSPSVFSPSVFSPSVFSPDAYAPSVFSQVQGSPSVFSPSVFSPSVFSPSVFSPSVFSPSVFSPSVFSPSVFSPSVFSPSVFSPSVFSPSVFSPTEIAQAFSSAQTRSIIGVSATPGTVDESVVVNTWNNTGYFYIRVGGRGAAFSATGQFTLGVATTGNTACNNITALAPNTRPAVTGPPGTTTVILTDSTMLSLSAAVPGGTLSDKLNALATTVGGVVVDVNDDPRVQTLRAQANGDPPYPSTNKSCPYAKNLLAEEIKAIVDSYRPNNSGLRYVVIAGSDAVIPFFRYPDESLLGQESGFVPPVLATSASEASLRRDYVLSQDAYGSKTQISLRTSNLPIPDLAVGRLVELPDEIAGMIDAFTANPVMTPSSSLVTGYDFLADAAGAVQSEFASAGIINRESLITPNDISPQNTNSYAAGGPWTATDLRTKLLDATRHDVIFLAGHFSANSALAADFTTSMLTTDLLASPTGHFTNSLVMSAGCHAGYNIVDTDAALALGAQPVDWTQAFARKGATLLAGTGYQYGDTDFIEYSERLYLNVARELRAGTSPAPIYVGEALVKAKQAYLAATPDMRGIHQKAFLEATLFGLPMLGVNMPNRGFVGSSTTLVTQDEPVTGSAATLGLKVKTATVAPTLGPPNPLLLKIVGGTNVEATWLSGPDGVVSNPAEPALPLAAYNVTPTDATVLRGVGFRGGSYADTTVTPLTGAPTTELRGVHVPFVSPDFYPMRLATVNYFGALGSDVTSRVTSLLVTPAQHKADNIGAGTSIRRQYSSLNLRLYYSGNTTAASNSDAPTIVSVDAQLGGGGVVFTAQVVGDPAAAIYQVWITYTADGLGAWTSLPQDLVQCVRPAANAPLPPVCTVEDSRVWMGQLATVPAGLKYVVQAASGTGLVTLDDNRGQYYTLFGGTPPNSTLAFSGSPPTAAQFGDSVAVTAVLGPASLASNKTVRVAIGSAARVGTTDSSGNVTVNVPVTVVPGSYPITASFAGDDTLAASSITGPTNLQVGPATTTLTPFSTGVGTTLNAPSIGALPGQPLMQEAVRYDVVGTGGTVGSATLFVNTDYLGRSVLPPTGLGDGTYAITAKYAGNTPETPNVPYGGATATLGLTLLPQSLTFGGGGLPPSITVGVSAPSFTVSSQSGQPVTVALSTDTPATICTLTHNNDNSYTLTAVGPGPCKLSITAGGTTTFGIVDVQRTVPIMGNQNITFGPLGPKTYGDADFSVSATASSGLAVTFAASGNCYNTGSMVHITGAGSCTITASQAGNANFNAAPDVPRSFTVARAGQTINFPSIPPPTFVAGGTGTFTVAAMGGDSGNPVTFSSNTAGVCTTGGTNGKTVTMKSAGTCMLAADQTGNDNYAAAAQVLQSVSIGKASQTITFAGPGNQVAGTSVTLSASASSGLQVSFVASLPANCTVAGSTLTLVAAGTCTITASQIGNANFDAAPDVVRVVTITSANLLNVWTKVTAPMTKKRFQHTATRFESGQPLAGQVLIAGGFDRTETAQLTAELYNPATGTFVATGSMLTKAAGHTATLLLDGKVVVIGGGNAKVQRFDPTPKTWSQLSTSMSSNRTWHTATRLPDGRVLVIGGEGNSSSTLSSTLVYDPAAAGSLSNGPTMDTARERHTATLLTSGPNAGKVLVVGGRKKSGSNYVTLATYQLCDANVCTASTSGIAARYSHAAVALGAPNAGKTLVVGGANGSTDLASAELYDSATGTWAVSGTLGVLLPARRDLTLSELPNGRALAVGGSFSGNAKKDADAYTPPIAAMADMWTPRAGHTATPLRDAAGNITGILVTGGADTDADADDALDSAEIYGTP